VVPTCWCVSVLNFYLPIGGEGHGNRLPVISHRHPLFGDKNLNDFALEFNFKAAGARMTLRCSVTDFLSLNKSASLILASRDSLRLDRPRAPGEVFSLVKPTRQGIAAVSLKYNICIMS